MRVLHAVTLHTPTSDFGGPTRVALNLSRGLRERGVDARLVTLGDGFEGGLPDEVEGVPSFVFQAQHLLPKFEVSGITSLPMLAKARALVRSADVVHVHLMRDLVTLPFALIALQCGKPLVLQTHGMIDPTEKRVARLVDVLGLRRVLRRADTVLYLTEVEREGVQAVVPETPLRSAHRLVNGVSPQERRPQRTEGPPTVVFMSRVQERKRPEEFIRAMPAVLAEYPDARFVLAGPDTGALAAPMMELARELGVGDSVTYIGAVEREDVLDFLRTADVYVLSATYEPFPVSVLEAMSVGVPVVITKFCGQAPEVAEYGAGVVTDSRIDADNSALVARGILELLEPQAGERASQAARQLVRDRFSIDAVVEELHGVYESVLKGS
ncbi:glycosyltransferase [Streptomyces polyrhachis]|uniref:D-inositol 3-phosphate glycosyltransferase n=1 Tax=Streptomyces polyrhachis TaxID=1282885 RepID=A0ABW2GGY4_9ACTN